MTPILSTPRSVQRLLRAGLLLLIATTLVGCAFAPSMPMSEDSAKLEADKALYLMTVSVHNAYSERYQPSLRNLVFADAKGVRKVGYSVDDKAKPAPEVEGGLQTFLMRFNADDEVQTIVGSMATVQAFPFIGTFFVPLHAPLEKAGPGVYYLGSVKATVRERKDNEFRAGGVLPLLDQSMVGASGGTFDIVIEDAYESDVALFRRQFPALGDTPVQKRLLPPWDRARAQAAWEKE